MNNVVSSQAIFLFIIAGGGKLTEGWTNFAPKGGIRPFDAWKNRSKSRFF
jgi:hypothetical protein